MGVVRNHVNVGQCSKADELENKGEKMRTMTIAAIALVTALSARAEGFDDLTFRTNVWFEAAFTNVEVGTAIADKIGITQGAGSWSWTVVSPSGTATNAVENETKFIALSSDLDDQLTFTPAPFAVTSGYETVVATIKADAGDELLDFEEDPQAAFTAIVTNGTLQAFGLTDAGWTNLVYGSVEALTNNWFTLYMDFANGEDSTRYVRYSVQTNNGSVAVLTDNTGASWFSTTYNPTITSISFSGVGKVQTFSGDELTVPIAFGEAAVVFLADYQTATSVVATVSGTVAADTTFKLTAGGEAYEGIYNDGSVKFYNVVLADAFALGSTVGYTLSATDAGNNYTGTAADVPRSTTVGYPTGGWIAEDSANSGSGTWSTNSVTILPLPYPDGKAALNNHLFTPTNAVGDAIVTVTSEVCFGDVADPAVAAGPDSYAAIRLAEVNSTKTFQIWAKETENGAAGWISVSNGNDVDPTSTTTVQSNFDFVKGTCSFTADETALTNASGVASFYLANGVRKLTKINFNGVGTLTSLNGSYLATKQIAQVVDGTNVTVSSKWVAEKLPRGTTIDQAQTLLNPVSTRTIQHGSSHFNYFECYALGIDPAREDKVPEISDPTVDESGKISFSLNGVEAPSGVTLTVTMKSYDSPDGEANVSAAGVEGSMTIVGGGETTNNLKVDPSQVDSVKYYKFDISIGATP